MVKYWQAFGLSNLLPGEVLFLERHCLAQETLPDYKLLLSTFLSKKDPGQIALILASLPRIFRLYAAFAFPKAIIFNSEQEPSFLR